MDAKVHPVAGVRLCADIGRRGVMCGQCGINNDTATRSAPVSRSIKGIYYGTSKGSYFEVLPFRKSTFRDSETSSVPSRPIGAALPTATTGESRGVATLPRVPPAPRGQR